MLISAAEGWGYMTDEDRSFQGEIKVAARVIDYLSSGLYENAAACLKELINNSYDADATEVVVSVKPDADFIAIEDNGTGMTQAQFVEHFSRVAESHKRDSGQETEKKRKKIGKIGIGFIAANELCDEMEIYSTCKGSPELLHVTIRFGEIRNRSYEKRKTPSGDVKKGDYDGVILEEDPKEHYTKVYLKRIREEALPQFIAETGNLSEESSKSIYGLNEDTVRRVLASLNTWDELDLYSQTRLRIGMNVPVKYLPNWTLPEHEGALASFTKRAAASDFRVIYDGTDLVKPAVLTDPKKMNLLKVLNYEDEEIQVHGYLFARHGVYKPSELNGILLRIRESAVGDYDNGFLGFPKHIEALFQDWVTGELYVNGELDDALNIDRRTLRDTHSSYVKLQSWFIQELRAFLRDVRTQMYKTPSEERQVQRAQGQREKIKEVAKRVEESYGKETAAKLTSTWANTTEKASASETKKEVRKLTRTYSVGDVYEIAVDVAQEVLPADLAEQFITELTRRLRD
ncbi:hypothetical protein GCM10011609_42580 [Lentzea pudingi]|uniref:Histidine kinase-, DNA gyrase B-, and HSP90-like ATPase n=1 Tax=Lentzea pudingi TaxID=1789439 RepID=A0ABQ2I3T7_9PSEU|nr:ATP-binding protein [Lentzea pudingi]GGM99683.1 hypothetical protein GCM10011609_42580 [Lentzea pudingi]